MYEYLERRNLLQKPSEQSKLLTEVPKVTPDALDPQDIQDLCSPDAAGMSFQKGKSVIYSFSPKGNYLFLQHLLYTNIMYCILTTLKKKKGKTVIFLPACLSSFVFSSISQSLLLFLKLYKRVKWSFTCIQSTKETNP